MTDVPPKFRNIQNLDADIVAQALAVSAAFGWKEWISGSIVEILVWNLHISFKKHWAKPVLTYSGGPCNHCGASQYTTAQATLDPPNRASSGRAGPCANCSGHYWWGSQDSGRWDNLPHQAGLVCMRQPEWFKFSSFTYFLNCLSPSLLSLKEEIID